MREFTKEESAFIKAVKAMEKRTARVSAYVILRNGEYAGRVIVSYPADGAGRLYVIGWLPGQPGAAEKWTRHHRWASGGGYDKASAAMSGAKVWNMRGPSGAVASWATLQDNGRDWRHQLEDMGYEVVQAV